MVEKESHLLELCRYVVLNPLRVKGKAKIEHWKWSSYRAAALAHYRTFVRDGLEGRPWEHLTGQIYLGSESFIEEHTRDKKKYPEIPRAQLQAARPALQQIFGKRSKNANEAAYTKYGDRRREIAEHMGVHYAA